MLRSVADPTQFMSCATSADAADAVVGCVLPFVLYSGSYTLSVNVASSSIASAAFEYLSLSVVTQGSIICPDSTCASGEYHTGNWLAGACFMCSAGYYCPDGVHTTICPAGQFTAASGQTICTPCDSAHFCTGGTSYSMCLKANATSSGLRSALECAYSQDGGPIGFSSPTPYTSLLTFFYVRGVVAIHGGYFHGLVRAHKSRLSDLVPMFSCIFCPHALFLFVCVRCRWFFRLAKVCTEIHTIIRLPSRWGAALWMSIRCASARWLQGSSCSSWSVANYGILVRDVRKAHFSRMSLCAGGACKWISISLVGVRCRPRVQLEIFFQQSCESTDIVRLRRRPRSPVPHRRCNSRNPDDFQCRHSKPW